MDKYQETFNTWNKVAAPYQDKFMDMDLYNETYRFICQNISKNGAKLLEIGCGPGNISKQLLSERPDFDIYGIDIAPNMIALAKINNPTAHFEVMDCRAIDTLQTKFDGIIAGFCLPYLSEEDSEKLLADAAALLTENGLLYISFVEGTPEASGFIAGSSGDRVYFYYHHLDTLKEQLLRNNFELLKIFHVAYPKTAEIVDMHTILTAKKISHD
jgi:2-polyprenyl-3-methyl-5-hydroxy-6-metoxy-1,4-benzoquinol methylase